MEFLVKVPEEVADKILIDNLQRAYFELKLNIDKRKVGDGFVVFHTDQSKDILESIKYLDAIILVLDFFGVSDPEFKPD
jgi:hypothetical protein